MGSVRRIRRIRTVTWFRRRRRPHRDRWIALATALALVGTASAIFFANRGSADCVLALGSDRSLSGDSASLVAERTAEATSVLSRYETSCRAVLVESIGAGPGRSQLWVGPLGSSAHDTLDALDEGRANHRRAEQELESIFAARAQSGTDILAFFYDVAGAMKEFPAGTPVQLWVFSDGLETVGFNLYTLDFTDQKLHQLLAELPRLDASSWRVHFVSVNRVAIGVVTDRMAQTAELVWRALITAWGGDLVSYTATIVF